MLHKMHRTTFVEEFQKKLALTYNTGYQRWWNKFLFHFTDISNAVSILNSNKLYSRNKALQLGLMHNDNADDDVIDNTGLNTKEYVRFYFGALTPTQYHNEGFKPKKKIHNNAHCPVPVFLLFDFVKLLGREDSHFSTGNMAAQGVEVFNDIKDLDKLEFDYIYHRGSTYHEPNPNHITYCRHAEVLIPNELNIDDCLKYVVVRSEAEKQTLLCGLDVMTKEKFKDKIRVKKNGLFYADRFYIENIMHERDIFRIIFSKPTADKFDFTFKVTDRHSGLSYIKDIPQISLESKGAIFKIKPEFVSSNLSLQIAIDGHLAYENDFTNIENLIM